MALPKVLSFNEIYPFEFQSSVNTTEQTTQTTSDENSKSPDEEQSAVATTSISGGFTKNKMFIFIGIAIALIGISHLGK